MSSPGEFTYTAQRRDDTVVLALHGELDLATAPDLEEAADEVLASSCTHFVIDLRDLDFLDSSGMRAFLRIQAKLGAGVGLELIRGPQQVQRVFELAGLTAALPFRDA
jgi:anti-sigma B factor antagonist